MKITTYQDRKTHTVNRLRETTPAKLEKLVSKESKVYVTVHQTDKKLHQVDVLIISECEAHKWTGRQSNSINKIPALVLAFADIHYAEGKPNIHYVAGL